MSAVVVRLHLPAHVIGVKVKAVQVLAHCVERALRLQRIGAGVEDMAPRREGAAGCGMLRFALRPAGPATKQGRKGRRDCSSHEGSSEAAAAGHLVQEAHLGSPVFELRRLHIFV